MNKIKYRISTPFDDEYQLDKDGYVIKFSNGLDLTNSPKSHIEDWQVLGIVELKPFGNIDGLIPLSEAVGIDNYSFKNGNPKYTIIDLDHGTKRVIGNTKYHGVRSICILN